MAQDSRIKLENNEQLKALNSHIFFRFIFYFIIFYFFVIYTYTLLVHKVKYDTYIILKNSRKVGFWNEKYIMRIKCRYKKASLEKYWEPDVSLMPNLPVEFSRRHRDPIASQAPKIARTPEHFCLAMTRALKRFRAKTHHELWNILAIAREEKKKTAPMMPIHIACHVFADRTDRMPQHSPAKMSRYWGRR